MPKQNVAESAVDILNIKLKPAVAHLRTTIPGERRNIAVRETLLRRIRAEFEDMPGLSLTLGQATRLFGVTADAGSRILQGLVEARVLHMTADSRYALRAEA